MSTAFAGAVQGTDGRPFDQIRLTGLSATGHHGVFEHERLEGQLFRADVVLHLDTRPAAAGDDLADTVSYAVVAEDVVAVLAGSPADLIETVAERVAAVALRHPAVVAVDVAVHKPQAPITVPFDDVQVVVRRDRVKVPVVADEAPRVVPIPVGSITPAVLGNVAVTEPAAPQDQHVVMPPSIPPVAPAPAPDRSPDQGVFADTAEDLGPAAVDAPHAGGVSDQEFVDALDSFYSAPQDALSAPAETFEPAAEHEPVPQPDRSAPEVGAEPTPVAAEPFREAAAAPSEVAEPAEAPAAALPVPAAQPAVPDGSTDPAVLAVREVPVAPETTPADGPLSGGHVLPDDVAPVAYQVAAEPSPVEPSPVEPSPAEHVPADEAVLPVAAQAPAESPAVPGPVVEAPSTAPFAAEAPSVETGPVAPALPEHEPVAAPVPLPVRPAPEDAEAPVGQTAAEAPVVPEAVPVPAVATDRLDEAPAGFVPVVLALGANLGDAQQTLRDAVTDLDRISGLEITDVSPLARTAAVGGPEQPDYLNAILLARTTLAPRALLRAVQAVENAHGRVRAERNGPRTLDVDLVVFGTVTEFTEDLELPHPRAHERAFVLEPWAQIAPDAVLPGLGGGPVAALAATAPDRGGIRWLALDWLTDAEPEAAPAAAPVDEAPATAGPARQVQAEPEPVPPSVEVAAPEPTTAPTTPARPGGELTATPQEQLDPVGHAPVTAAPPFVQDQPTAPSAPGQPSAQTPAQTPSQAAGAQAAPAQQGSPERAVEQPGPFVPAFHPVHPQDGQEPPHAQVPPLWADVSQAASATEPRAQVPPTPAGHAQVAPEEPVTPQFHPVHQAPANPFEPQQPAPAVEQQGGPSAQPPITGVPMSFPADLRGPSS